MEIKVPGMSCGPCARAVTDAVRNVDAEAVVDIDLTTKRVSIETDADPEAIAAAIEDAGYNVHQAAA